MSQILRTALRELIAEAKHFSILDRAVAKADAVLLAEHKRDPNTCYYCGLHHDRVEAGGVYHCPNNLCTGPGAGGFRSTLKSYKETQGERHIVDPHEVVSAAIAKLADEPDQAIRAAVYASVSKWLPEEPQMGEPPDVCSPCGEDCLDRNYCLRKLHCKRGLPFHDGCGVSLDIAIKRRR